MNRALDIVYGMIGITLATYGALALFEIGFQEGKNYALTNRIRQKSNIIKYPFRIKSGEEPEASNSHCAEKSGEEPENIKKEPSDAAQGPTES